MLHSGLGLPQMLDGVAPVLVVIVQKEETVSKAVHPLRRLQKKEKTQGKRRVPEQHRRERNYHRSTAAESGKEFL